MLNRFTPRSRRQKNKKTLENLNKNKTKKRNRLSPRKNKKEISELLSNKNDKEITKLSLTNNNEKSIKLYKLSKMPSNELQSFSTSNSSVSCRNLNELKNKDERTKKFKNTLSFNDLKKPNKNYNQKDIRRWTVNISNSTISTLESTRQSDISSSAPTEAEPLYSEDIIKEIPLPPSGFNIDSPIKTASEEFLCNPYIIEKNIIDTKDELKILIKSKIPPNYKVINIDKGHIILDIKVNGDYSNIPISIDYVRDE